MKCSQFLFLPFTVRTRFARILIIKDLPNPLFLLFFFSFFKTKTRSRKANTHKDNNEIPLRAKEVLPGNRKDFSSFKSLLVYTLGLRMQYRGVYKEECSMKKVCASLFLIILLLAAIVPVSAAGTLR